MPVALRPQCRGGAQFVIREYQVQASESYVGNAQMPGGSGVVVLPCGAGKTIVGLYVMSLLKRRTLILVTNVTASHQWKRELLDKTDIPAGPDRRIQQRIQGHTARHHRHLPDLDLPQEKDRPVHPFRAVQFPELGADHLRRGAPAARAGLQVYGEHSGAPPPGPYRHAHPRGRPRKRRFYPHRA